MIRYLRDFMLEPTRENKKTAVPCRVRAMFPMMIYRGPYKWWIGEYVSHRMKKCRQSNGQSVADLVAYINHLETQYPVPPNEYQRYTNLLEALHPYLHTAVMRRVIGVVTRVELEEIARVAEKIEAVPDYIRGSSYGRRKIAEEQAVANWPEPRTHKDVQIFLGFANFYRLFITHFSRTAAPLSDLLKSGEKGKFTSKFEFCDTSIQLGRFEWKPMPQGLRWLESCLS